MRKKFLLAIGLAVGLGFSSCSEDLDDPISASETIERDDKIIQDFFVTNNVKDTIADANGVYIDIISEGSGESPEEGDVVRIKYAYYSLPSNKLVAEVDELIKMELASTLAGLNIGIPYMKKGGEADIYIPSRHAFFGSTSSLANSVLRFRITLEDFTETVDEMDDIIIQEYFTDNEITDAIKDDSGVYIQHIITGTGDDHPTATSNVKVKYELYTLPDDTKVPQTDEAVTFELGTLIKGWQVGIPYMKKGGEAYLYVPSSSAYRGTSNELASEVLKFKITLVDF